MTETPKVCPFVAHAHRWDTNRYYAGELRVVPAKNLRDGAPMIPGVAVFKGTHIIASLTEDEATEYANSIIDALEFAQNRHPGKHTEQATA